MVHFVVSFIPLHTQAVNAASEQYDGFLNRKTDNDRVFDMKLRRKRVKPIGLKDVTIIDDARLRKAITAASLGNAMEWFDFGVYGFVAYALGQVFFPGADPGTQMIAALATFSVPFLIRPLGGLFFGSLGDKYGRQKILSMTIIIMSVSTFCIGLIPSYASIGIWAPILLLLCKMAQGFSVGGEYTGASIFVAEYSPDRKRGFMGSWLDFGSIAGFVLGAGLVVLISAVIGEAKFLEWGWRIPFFVALPLGIIGLYLRHALEETPAFQQHVDKLEQGDREGLADGPKVSFKEIATKHWKSLLACVGLVIATNVTYYMLLTYMPSYLSHNLHYSEDHGVMIIIAIMLGMLFVQPVMGLMSDKFGRRPFVIIGSIALLTLAIPCFMLINSGVMGLIFAGLLILAVILNSFTGVMASSLPAMFPTHIRYSALASAFNISVLIAGLTPTAAAWLVEATSNLYMPAYYLMVVAVIGLVTGIMMKETANLPLRGATPAASDMAEAKEILQEHHDNIEQKIEDINDQITELEAKRSHLINQHPRINE
ncbi:Proline/betaine transporter [Erwinia piriflorinigrans CFBP 5888]|uniref:Proline/betaine transporter n=2 Tax=Erwinia piriflorinigrans TaxID=665097 RepID=V5ZD90_9GAMM|nr:Proline/betaine transporter [Erwinia piriflorinigrans CFBP 5888]